MAAPMENQQIVQNPHVIADLETSFLNCLSLLTSQEYFNVQDSDESKASIENAMQKFLELSRQVEAFFLKKKMLASYQKPDQPLNDDIADLRAELARKDQVLEKHMERLKWCQNMLTSSASTGQPAPQPHPPPQQQQQPPIQQSLPHQQVPPTAAPAQHPVGPGAIPQYQPHPMQQMPPQGPGMGPPYQGYPGRIHTPPMQGPLPQMQQHPMGMGGRPQAPPSYAQGPLAYLEQTTSNIGLPDRR